VEYASIDQRKQFLMAFQLRSSHQAVDQRRIPIEEASMRRSTQPLIVD
jgi:hypothetical protein